MGRTYVDGNTVRADVSERRPLVRETLVVEERGRRNQIHLYRDRYDGQLRLEYQEDKSIIAPLFRLIPERVLDGACRLLLSFSIIFIFLTCYQCVHLDTMVSTRLTTIEQKRTQLEQLRVQNADLQAKINDAVNPDQIYRDAVEKYGMVLPDQTNTIVFEKTGKSEYIRQYDSIPSGQSATDDSMIVSLKSSLAQFFMLD